MDKKYTLKKDQDSGLYRIISTGKLEPYPQGVEGGLVEGDHNLSHEGYSWIHHTCTVAGTCLVQSDAQIKHATNINASGWVKGNTTIQGADITGYLDLGPGCIINGSPYRPESRVTINGHITADGPNIRIWGGSTLRGDVNLDRFTHIGTCINFDDPDNYVVIDGSEHCVRLSQVTIGHNAHIDASSQYLSISVGGVPWRLSAYRALNKTGYTMSIGCQRPADMAALKELAAEYCEEYCDSGGLEEDQLMAQIDGFAVMVKAMVQSWGGEWTE